MVLWIVVHSFMGASDMRKFIVHILAFFAIVTIVDFSAGKILHYLQKNVAGGRTGNEY